MQDDRWYAAKLLSVILGDSSGSRYFWSLVDPAIADTAFMELASMDSTGALCSYICCDPENAAQVEDILHTLFAKVMENGIESGELEAARNKVLSSVAIKSAQPMGRLVISVSTGYIGMNTYQLLRTSNISVRYLSKTFTASSGHLIRVNTPSIRSARPAEGILKIKHLNHFLIIIRLCVIRNF
jgi:hypothetical protein